MTFTTPCFVRVENPEKRNNLREWAKNIGYNFVDVAGIESDYSDPQPYIEVFPHSFRSTTPQGNSFYAASRKAIDCGENIELFKALDNTHTGDSRYADFAIQYSENRKLIEKALGI